MISNELIRFWIKLYNFIKKKAKQRLTNLCT